VIGLHQAGFENAVSSMGTALSQAQLRQLKRYSRKIVLALDADTAGDRATLRGLEIAREALDREPDPVFAARGLVRFEGRLDAELRIVNLPEGKDPDEVVEEDPEAWPQLIDSAKTVVDYVMDMLSADLDLDDAKNKAEIAEQILPLIEDVADPVEREAYRQKLARRLRIDERALMNYAPKSSQSRNSPRTLPQQAQGPSMGSAAASKLERFCLGVLLKAPETLYRLDREMQSLDLERIGEDDFTSSDHRVVFRVVRSALQQHDEEPSLHCRERLNEHLLAVADELAAEVEHISLDQPKVLSEVLTAFLRLRQRRLGMETSQVQYRLMSAQETGTGDQDGELNVDHMTQTVHQLAVQKARLDRALSMRGLAGLNATARS
ncbi:MAG: toprim domain-containing protein, partial [Anaerolineales bacterium]|nr:toprim domain-containing protein [Anaerolineales bacterium]